VNTVESRFPKTIKTDQPWIGENALGDWFYRPDFVYSAQALIRYMLEVVSRDGIYAVNIPIRPDGSLDPECVKLLAEVGAWMKINGEGIYGSKAWVKLGEGVADADGNLRVMPYGALRQAHADFLFGPTDFRFTVGKDGSVYAFALAAPQPGAHVKIVSLGTGAGLLAAPIHSVALLGSSKKLVWKQHPEGLEIVCPARMPSESVVAFKVR
jgi:alpha-L-fucosidase